MPTGLPIDTRGDLLLATCPRCYSVYEHGPVTGSLAPEKVFIRGAPCPCGERITIAGGYSWVPDRQPCPACGSEVREKPRQSPIGTLTWVMRCTCGWAALRREPRP